MKRVSSTEVQPECKKFKALNLNISNLIKAAVNCSVKVESIVPSACCALCGKILYANDVHFVNNAEVILPKINTTHNAAISIVTRGDKISMCKECFHLTKSKRTHFNFFNNFSELPVCIKHLNNYGDYRKLSIGTLFCSTFRPYGYTYTHLQGKMSFGITPESRQGMLGILHNTDTPQSSNCNNNDKLKIALQWLKTNNFLYRNYLSTYETIPGHLQQKTTNCSFPGLPQRTSDITFKGTGQISQKDVENSSGLVIPADNRIPPKADANNYQVGEVVSRNVLTSHSPPASLPPEKLQSSDENLEAKIFPHLFPDGQGSWSKQKFGLTLGQYHKHRLLHIDRRWANDKLYLFFAFDRNMKVRILSHPKIPTLTNANRKVNVTTSDLTKSENEYQRYGHILPASVTGSKSFWRKKWLDLVAMVRELGPADLFVTLTANDRWNSLKTTLSMYDQQQTIFHPVDTTEYFFKRFEGIKPLLFGTNSVFGEVSDHWYRIEAQNRGALHVHCLIWLHKSAIKENLVSAEIPTGTDHFSQNIISKVKDYQMHTCRPNRCFRTAKGLPTKSCKYGFPYNLRDDDGYAADGLRYEYTRRKPEDSRVVPYNPYLLYVWDAHINVQHVTRTGLERYLVKYVAKVEPTFGLVVRDNPVASYFETRIVGAPEAAAAVLSHKFVSGTRQVIFIDTNLPNQRSRVLKSFAQLESCDDGDDIFMKNGRDFYTERPHGDIFDDITLPDFLTKYEIFTNKSKIPKNRPSIHTDLEGRYVVKRTKFIIPRYHFLTPLDSEAFYFQTLLLNVPYRSEIELISPENQSKTYKEECYLRSVFYENDAIDMVFTEMKERNFDPLQIAKMARKLLIEQISDEQTISKKIKGLELGQDVHFQDENLPEYETVEMAETQLFDMNSLEIMKVLQWSKDAIIKDQQSLNSRLQQMTKSQQSVFSYITCRLDQQVLAFVTGPGGCGKSFLLRTLMLHCEFNGLIVEVLGTTGCAALLVNGRTIHQFFKLDPELNTRMDYKDTTWESVSAVDVLIIDEVSMMTAEILEKISELCIQTAPTSKNKQLFGGKSIILFGDLLQLPAVTNNVSLNRQIYESPLWNKFYPLFLHENCRQSKDETYAKLLNRVRIGQQTEHDLQILQSRVCGFGHEINQNCKNTATATSMVICSKHAQRQQINENMQNTLFPNSEDVVLHARDCDISGNTVSYQETEYINTVKSVLQKSISVRIGTKVMITRNLNVQDRIVNGTTGFLRSVHSQVLMVQRIDSDELIPVTKVKQRIILPITKVPVYRIQFPIIIAYACTVHRMQGTTLKTAFIHMDENFFANGQAYVALSRVQSLEGLHLLAFSSDSLKTDVDICQMLHSAEQNKVLNAIQLPKKGEITFNKNKSKEINIEPNEIERPISGNSSKNDSSVTLPLQLSSSLSNKIPINLCKDLTKLQKVLQQYETSFKQLAFTLGATTAVFSDALPIEVNVQNQCHPTFLQHYVPVKTPGRGDCLWQMISISICQQPDLFLPLRLLTVHILMKYKAEFLKLLQSDNNPNKLNILQQFEELVVTARTRRQWGNEYHLYALCIGLNRPIYIYSTFKINGIFRVGMCSTEQLQTFLNEDSNLVGRHLKYVPDHEILPNGQLGAPLLGFYQHSHYTAILPKDPNSPLFIPNCSILPR